MAGPNSPFTLNFDSVFSPEEYHRRLRRNSDLLAPPRWDQPATPVRGRERSQTTNTLPVNTSWRPSTQGPRIDTKCEDCSGNDICPLHDFVSQDTDREAPPRPEPRSTKAIPSALAGRSKPRPKLRLQTPGKVQGRQLQASSLGTPVPPILKRPEVRRSVTDDATANTPPSGSTLVDSGSTPGSATKKWAKQKVSFVDEQARSNSRTPLRPKLLRTSSSQSVQSDPVGQEKKGKRHRSIQRLFFFHRYSADDTPQPDSRQRDYTARRDSHLDTPIQFPRRISRLPSFFTRERLILPERIQRRDVVLLSASLILVVVFTTVGILAAARPDQVCKAHWLAVAIDSFLPNLVISTPYTYLVVGFAVSAPGKRWINGRYTPLLYATCAALGRVAVGSLTGNVTWKVFKCNWGGA